MTEEQMRKRIKEIDEERKRLASEKDEYEKYLSEKKRNKERNNNKEYIGKCFLTKNLKENKHSYIKAFQIIDVKDVPNERYALCLALIDGYRNTCWHEHGIQIMTLPVWGKNELRLMFKESDPEMIDFYEEVSPHYFYDLYREYNYQLEADVMLNYRK